MPPYFAHDADDAADAAMLMMLMPAIFIALRCYATLR